MERAHDDAARVDILKAKIYTHARMNSLSFVHPTLHTPLVREQGGYRSPETGEFLPDQDGVPSFLPPALRTHVGEERSDLVSRIKTLLRTSPLLYRILIYLISPVCYVTMTARKFLRRFPKGTLVLNVGSGVHRYRDDIINLDIFPYKDVDVIAEASTLPFPDNTFDGALCECLLEHVPNPQKVVSEILRVLKPGGQAFITAPFVYPFHGCPNDFYRWSISGMRELCKEADITELDSRSGPTSALVAQLVTWLATIFSFGSHTLYHLLSMVLLIPIAPFKFLDLLIGRLPTSIYGPEAFYVILAKRPYTQK